MTISKWERGAAAPTAYQVALMAHFQKVMREKKNQASEEVKKLLVGAGVVAALAWLFSMKRGNDGHANMGNAAVNSTATSGTTGFFSPLAW